MKGAGEDGHGDTALLDGPDVGNGTTDVGHGGGGDETGDHAASEHGGNVLGEARGEGEEEVQKSEMV
jgi:hypothetical protein